MERFHHFVRMENPQGSYSAVLPPSGKPITRIEQVSVGYESAALPLSYTGNNTLVRLILFPTMSLSIMRLFYRFLLGKSHHIFHG